MAPPHFDTFARALTGTRSRRVTLGAVLAGPAVAASHAPSFANRTKQQKKRKKHKRRKRASSQPEMWVDVQPEQVWTQLGSSSQFGSMRHVVDLSNFTEIKMMGMVATAGSGELRIDWEINPSQNDFATLVGTIDLSTTGVKQTSYVEIPSEAQGLINIVAAAAGGSGSDNDPEVRGVAIMVR